MSRKQIYNIMFDMLKENDLSGAQLLDICLTNMAHERAVDVITDVFKMIIPAAIKRYCPAEHYLTSHARVFDLVHGLLTSGTLEDKSTRHLLIDCLIKSAKSEAAIKTLMGLFDTGALVDG